MPCHALERRWSLAIAFLLLLPLMGGPARAAAPILRPPLTPEARARTLAASHDASLPAWQQRHLGYLAERFVRRPAPNRAMSTLRADSSSAPAQPTVAGDCRTWQTLFPDTEALTRSQITTIYDPVRNRMIFFGGLGELSNYHNDVWALSLGATPTWTEIVASGTPPPARGAYSAIYDANQDRMVIFGGADDANFMNDVWSLSLSGAGSPAWNEILPGGTGPSPRYLCSAVYDGSRNRMVIYGGASTDNGALDEIWSLSLTGTPAWTPITPSGTPPDGRTRHVAIYDAPRDRMVVFGGATRAGYTNEVWTLPFASNSWGAIAPSGTPPMPRAIATAVFDAPRNRMLVYSGYAENGVDFAGDTNDLWALALSGSPKWTQVFPTGEPPAPTELASSIYDATGQRFITFGGIGAAGDEVWAVNLGSGGPAWTQLPVAGMPPKQRDTQTAIYDAPRHRLIMFGGYGASDGGKNDTWAFDLSGAGGWTLIAPTGTRPPRRWHHTAIFDAPHNRMLVYGGYSSELVAQLGDVWALSLSGTPAWTKLNPSGTPPGEREAHTAIFDSVHNRMIVYGGYGFDFYEDVWALSLSGGGTWTRLLDTSTPGPGVRFDHSAIDDPVRDRMLMFDVGETWSLSLSSPAWTSLATSGSPGSFVATYDSGHDRALLTDSQAFYALDLTSLAWTTLSMASGGEPDMRSSCPLIYDVANDRPVFQGGCCEYNDVVTIAASDLFAVHATPSPDAGGVVTFDPDRACFADGSTVTLTATPNLGYVFDSWSGDASGSANPLTLTVHAPTTVVAQFIGYTMTTLASPAQGGVVAVDPSQDAYEPGSVVTLTPEPAANYSFDHWSGDAAGNAVPLTIVMDGNKTVTANFVGPPPPCETWVQLAPSADPGFRTGAVSAWDPVRHRMTMFGGYDGANFLNDVWVLETSPLRWIKLTPTGTPPSPRDGAGMVYDPAQDRLIVIGGNNSTGFLGDSWALSLAGTPAWTPINAAGPLPVLFAPAVVYDSARNRVLLHGGLNTFNRQEVWSLSLASPPEWKLVVVTGTLPAGRYTHAAIYDPVGDRMVIYGGVGNTYYHDTWQLTLGTPTPTWSRLNPYGSPPRAAMAMSAIFDPVRDAMIQFGGRDQYFDYQETNVLSLKYAPAWIPLPALGTVPSPRNWHVATYDPDVRRMLVLGGQSNSDPVPPSTFSLDMNGGFALDVGLNDGFWGSVLQTPPTSCHTPGEQITLTAQPRDGYEFLGWSGDVSGTANPATVTMDGYRVVLAQFSPLATPTELSRFDARRSGSGIELVWQFGNPGQVASVAIERAEATTGPWTAVDAATRIEDGVWLALDARVEPGRAYFYRLVATMTDGSHGTYGPIETATEAIAVTSLARVSPIPSRGSVAIEFTLARAGRARVSILDVVGRVRAVVADGMRPAGHTTLMWDGRGPAGDLVAPGVYFLRWDAPGASEVRRIVMVR